MFVKKKKKTTNEGLPLTPGASILEAGKGTVLLDGRQGRYFQLNGLGLIVVKSPGEAMGVNAIIHHVVEAYDVNTKTTDVDVRVFLAQIRELGVVA